MNDPKTIKTDTGVLVGHEALGPDFDAQIEQAVGDLQAKTILEQMTESNAQSLVNLDELASHYERERDKMAKLASDTRIGIQAIEAHQRVIDNAAKAAVAEPTK